MRSIFTTFDVNHPKTGKPIDWLGSMQIMFDQASLANKTLWEQTYVDRLCDFRPPKLGLTAEGIMGQYSVRIRAAVIGNDSDTPLRTGRGFEVWSGEIPRFGHKFKMTVKTLRSLLEVYENNHLNPEQKIKEMEKIILGDFKDGYLGCKDVADEILLKSLSGGGVALFDPAVDNPEGITYEVDYGMPSENKLLLPKEFEWTEANLNNESMDLLGLFVKIIYMYRQKGIEFKEIWVAPWVKYWMLRTLNIRLAALGRDKATRIVKEDEFDALLSSMKIPPIVEINKRTAYQKDGKPTNIIPWDENVVTFIPETKDKKLVEVQPAVEDNKLMPDPDVDYTDADHGIRIAKWRTGESSGQTPAEFTQATWRAVPIVTAINGVVNLQVRNTDKKFAEDASVINPTSADNVPEV